MTDIGRSNESDQPTTPSTETPAAPVHPDAKTAAKFANRIGDGDWFFHATWLFTAWGVVLAIVAMMFSRSWAVFAICLTVLGLVANVVGQLLRYLGSHGQKSLSVVGNFVGLFAGITGGVFAVVIAVGFLVGFK